MSDNTRLSPEMLTLNETSSRSGLPYGYIRKLCIQGKIVHIRTGVKYLVNWNKFVDYLNTEGRTCDE